ncbi:hypothetical protein Rrhod_1208 [Rhodococcus rhodnii LMG 5362]|uniref:Uncharacterized protein n=1 Tax=Rhodococcus rhodnii LMG 5362 TaxID=1273125 RepID=R7WQ25_9NOCA|nr:hypothetical protein Rrhod_1208 [Rhodococcus rhodnii LMG 5362]
MDRRHGDGTLGLAAAESVSWEDHDIPDFHGLLAELAQ